MVRCQFLEGGTMVPFWINMAEEPGMCWVRSLNHAPTTATTLSGHKPSTRELMLSAPIYGYILDVYNG